MATSEWLRFFEDAGIPPGPALGYAVAFVDNRIHKNMLLDLTRELMKELGITVVGDVIAILRHAKVVHRQEMCRAASQSLQPEAAGGSQRDPLDHRDHQWDHHQDPDRDPDRDHHRDHKRAHRDPPDHKRAQRDPPDHRDPARAPCGAAGRMITKSLSRDPALPLPPRGAPRNPPGAGISVTVPNGAGGSGAEAPPAVPKRRRVTAEAEGKYVISLPKGTTARSRHILRLHAARGLGRPSVFERLGAEAKAAAAAGAKPSGVFSRLGAAPEGPDPAADPGAGDPADPEALPYAGVLKKRRECSGTAATAAMAAQDGAVSSSGGGAWGCGQVSSSSRSVFHRLGRKPD
ncbi:uncharacterized protein C19orf47 homolog [Ammospiza caudacuta]|uniref:uncharacterized protein C19orf47 homolog n=1 Tax=Ammospiza caudacuta TaxID=2857398 RepID=UPI00273969DD|nr:uncharacterized protein C19orf47 homolog [Ammospiza caudacuta]